MKMWHLKTKLGTFWIIPTKLDSTPVTSCQLGIDDDPLGEYDSPEQAVSEVHARNTGYLKWDTQTKIRIPEALSAWRHGQPAEWRVS